jgi:hypothetical protein
MQRSWDDAQEESRRLAATEEMRFAPVSVTGATP